MENVNRLIEVLGADNAQKIKDEVTNIIIESIRDDFSDYELTNFLLCPEDVADFVNECKNEAFAKLRNELVDNMVSGLKKKLEV